MLDSNTKKNFLMRVPLATLALLLFSAVVGLSNEKIAPRPLKPVVPAASAKVYYENTVKRIIRRDCGRCHSGASRSLMDYDSLSAYADSGFLGTMVSPGGPMSRFAGADAQTILDWIDGGALEKPAAPSKSPAAGTAAFTFPGAGANCLPSLSRRPFPVDVPMDRVTYGNTIKYVLARDCMECHSGIFRNLATYERVKYYADNGLLGALVGRGGQMHRFAGPDSKVILGWVANGAPK